MTWHPVWFAGARFEAGLLALLLASIVGAIVGPILHNALPAYWIATDRLLGCFGRRLDKRQRKAADLVLRGFFFTVVVVLISFFAGRSAEIWLETLPGGMVWDALGLAVLMTSGAVWKTLLALDGERRAKGKARPYLVLARSTGIDLSGADDHGVTREAMTLAVRMLAMGMAAPLFWYWAAGLPAAFVYAGLAATAWHFGKNGFTKGFGIAALKAEALAGCIPALFAAWLVPVAALFTPTGGMVPALAGLLRRSGKSPYAQGGPPVTALAYALDVGLGGPAVDRQGSAMPRAWAGPRTATARLDPRHVRRALYLIVMAHLLLGLGLGIVILWINLR